MPSAERDDPITFEAMRALLLADYRLKGNRTDPTRHIDHLAAHFASRPGHEIDEDLIERYSRHRLEIDGAQPATVHRELSVLKRMLRLSSRRLPRMPVFRMPRVQNARQGFFEEADLQQLLPHLPLHARHLVEFLYLTGWRSSEAFRLLWRDVDWDQKLVWVRLSKSRDARAFPFKYHPRLEAVLRRQRQAVSDWERVHGRLCPAVFHWRGRPLGKLGRSWRRACDAAGLSGRYLHDFRRTAVRNLILAGVPQAIAMTITGHKTDSSFRRYLIVDTELMARATGQMADFLEHAPCPIERRDR